MVHTTWTPFVLWLWAKCSKYCSTSHTNLYLHTHTAQTHQYEYTHTYLNLIPSDIIRCSMLVTFQGYFLHHAVSLYLPLKVDWACARTSGRHQPHKTVNQRMRCWSLTEGKVSHSRRQQTKDQDFWIHLLVYVNVCAHIVWSYWEVSSDAWITTLGPWFMSFFSPWTLPLLIDFNFLGWHSLHRYFLWLLNFLESWTWHVFLAFWAK